MYTTFSLYTSSDGISVLDGIKTFKFILGADNAENSVTIATGTSKNIAITVTNNEKIKLQYGIYYSSTDDLTDVSIGYLQSSDYSSKGMIEPSTNYLITIKVYNESTSNVTITFGISYGMENGGDLILESGKSWIEELQKFPLYDADPGTYVTYAGTNGCSGASCSGQNANYVSDADMGYCHSSSYKFNVNGWRVGYIRNDTAYLVSAGAPECMCTKADGTSSDSSCSDYETTGGVPLHLANSNSKALKYCNPIYAYGGVCDSSSAWAMNATDFQNITGGVLSSCVDSELNPTCGYGNDLIDNGGFYWYATQYSSSLAYMFSWIPNYRRVSAGTSSYVIGVRPVLRMASTVWVMEGAGTYEDPYQIENPSLMKLSEVPVGSYVSYTGNNGCPSGHCDGTNANYVSDTDMGYCHSSSYKFNMNGWRVGYIQNDTAYIVSAGAPECMCTKADGTSSSSSCSDSETTVGVPQHLANLDTRALTYCNSDYAYGGACNSNSAWNMDASDFQIITGSALSSSSCARSHDDVACGYGNDILDNGGYYWYATAYSSTAQSPFFWAPDYRVVSYDSTRYVIGVRPVLRLASSILVVGGSGTYGDPYRISF